MNHVIVPQDMDGARLDQALLLLLPDSSLRARRRAWEEGAVLVDGRPRSKGFRVAAGQRLEMRGEQARDALPLGARVLEVQGGYAALFKPHGLHSAAIAGRDNASLERLLPGLLPGENAVLLNRLDRLTSGIVLAALSPEAATRYYQLEDAGQVTKEYSARVRGCLEWPVTVKNALDIENTKKTKILPREDESPLRWTRVEPVDYDAEKDQTLVRAVIHKGARHQIRAHLAHILLPIVMVCCAVGAFFAGRLADISGRKTILLISAVFIIVSAWCSGFAEARAQCSSSSPTSPIRSDMSPPSSSSSSRKTSSSGVSSSISGSSISGTSSPSASSASSRLTNSGVSAPTSVTSSSLSSSSSTAVAGRARAASPASNWVPHFGQRIGERLRS